MILPGVDLFDHAANAGSVFADDNEQVFGDETHLFVGVHDLDVSEALAVGADFVLAFDDEDASVAEDAVSLDAGLDVEVKDGVVVLAAGLSF